MHNPFDAIRPFHDGEVNAALRSIARDPMMKAYMQFTFPENTEAEWMDMLEQVHSTFDFQSQIVYFSLRRVLAKSSHGLTYSGFEQLDPGTAYLYISNHRDIVLDAAFLNFLLLEQGLKMTASAIGDNLVQIPFLHTLAKINRNFLVRRNLPPRELLESSRVLSAYIRHLMTQEQRSVWIAQREGRAKDGNDFTHPGVIKMIALAAGSEDLATFFKRLRIVPVAISYENDPTDALKLAELIAQVKGESYTKEPQEDIQHILTGISGQKQRIHFQAGNVLDAELDVLASCAGANQQIKALARIIDQSIFANYMLWPSNYIACDLLSGRQDYAAHYTQAEKEEFVERMRERVDTSDAMALKCFLGIYANPVNNRQNMSGRQDADCG